MSCTNDTDCDGAYVCFAGVKSWNASGSAKPGLKDGCWCSTWYGNNGPDCLEWDTPVAKYWVSICILNAFFAFLLCLLSGYDMFRLFQVTVGKFKFDVQVACLIQLIVAYVLLGIGEAIFGAQPIYPQDYFVYVGQKSASTQLSGYLCVLAGITCAFLACVSVAVVWLEVGTSSKRLKSRTAQNMMKFRLPMIIFEFAFVLAMFITFFAANSALLPFVAIVFEFIIVASYSAGYFVLSQVLKEAAAATPLSPQNAASTSGSGGTGAGRSAFTDVLQDMKHTLIAIVICILGTLAVSLSEAILSIQGWRDLTGPPNGPVPPIIGVARVISSFVLGLGYAVWGFTHRSLTRRMKRLEGVSTGENDKTSTFGTGGGTSNNQVAASTAQG